MFVNLQILRAFAAINVVLFHIISTSLSYGYETNIISILEGWGANGVDIFFVISGFLMLHTQILNQKGVSEFLLNRFIRLVRLYWLLTMSLIVLYIIVPHAFRESSINVEWALASLGFVSVLFLDLNPVV